MSICRIASRFFLQKMIVGMSTEACDFNNIEKRGLIKVFFLQGKLPKEIYAILKEILGNNAPFYATVKYGWSSRNVVNFPSVLRLVLEDPKSDQPGVYWKYSLANLVRPPDFA